MSTFDTDLAAAEAHARQVELISHVDTKLAKKQMKRDIEVARATSRTYQEARIWKMALIAGVMLFFSVTGCTAYTWGYESPLDLERERVNQEKYSQCVEAKGDWDNQDKTCEDVG